MDREQFVAVRRSVARGWRFLRGSNTGADILGVAAAFVSLQLLLVALSGVGTVGAAVLERGAVHVDIVADASDQRVQELYAALVRLPAAGEVTYVPRERVLESERERDADLAAFLERYAIDNPFPDTFEVTLKDRTGYDAVRELARNEAWQDVIDPSSLAGVSAQEAAVGELLEAVGAARMGVLLLAVLAAIVAAFLARNLLARLAALRRPDAHAEFLAGATPGVLAAPAIAAGILALLGALAASSVAAAFLTAAVALFPRSAVVGAFLTQSLFASMLPLAPLVLCAEAAAIGVLAWVVGRAGAAFRS